MQLKSENMNFRELKGVIKEEKKAKACTKELVKCNHTFDSLVSKLEVKLHSLELDESINLVFLIKCNCLVYELVVCTYNTVLIKICY